MFDGDTVAFSHNGHLNAERGYDRGFTEFGDNDPPTNEDVSPSPTLIKKKIIPCIGRYLFTEKPLRSAGHVGQDEN